MFVFERFENRERCYSMAICTGAQAVATVQYFIGARSG